ncbi:MAG: MBL fold metallo-hydrolase [Candidatus Dormibacteraeota bacterium]|nr:MBL fold metallo-hydrolase [Candidatus Dormibacteraeota bacterium]
MSDSVTWIGHSTVLIELDGVRLLTDPVLVGRVGHLRRTVPLDPTPPAGIDAVLVSHAHHDHLDPRSLAQLGREQRIIAPRGLRTLLRRRGFNRVEEVRVGDEARVAPVVVRATQADHPGRRLGLLGGDAPALGYLVAGSRRVYFAGDTDLFEGMADLCPALDVALLPVSGWAPRLGPGHLDPVRAARALTLLRPTVAVPIHWGTLAPLWPGGRPPSPEEPVAAFERHARELAPFTQVRVLGPGGTLDL